MFIQSRIARTKAWLRAVTLRFLFDDRCPLTELDATRAELESARKQLSEQLTSGDLDRVSIVTSLESVARTMLHHQNILQQFVIEKSIAAHAAAKTFEMSLNKPSTDKSN